MSQRDAHETYKVAAGRLHWAALILVVSLFLIALAMYWLATPLMRSVAKLPVPALPPAPRLQPNPAQDLAALRERERERLVGYGWIDRKRGVARIPIERAMQLLAQPPTSANLRPPPAMIAAPLVETPGSTEPPP